MTLVCYVQCSPVAPFVSCLLQCLNCEKLAEGVEFFNYRESDQKLWWKLYGYDNIADPQYIIWQRVEGVEKTVGGFNPPPRQFKHWFTILNSVIKFNSFILRNSIDLYSVSHWWICIVSGFVQTLKPAEVFLGLFVVCTNRIVFFALIWPHRYQLPWHLLSRSKHEEMHRVFMLSVSLRTSMSIHDDLSIKLLSWDRHQHHGSKKLGGARSCNFLTEEIMVLKISLPLNSPKLEILGPKFCIFSKKGEIFLTS